MTDPHETTVRSVPGEMQPWTDLEGTPGPMGGPVTLRWLEDVLPRGGRWLVVGPHDTEVLRAASERAEHLTVLLRSPADVEGVRAGLPDGVDLVVGALDGLGADEGPYDVVLAGDGLDRVLTPDSDDLSWPQRLDLVDRLATPGGTVLLGLANELAVTTLLDARVPRDRHGDEEWRPIHSDLERPCSLTQLRDALTSRGRDVAGVWATFGATTRPGLVAAAVHTDEARPDHLVADAAIRAVRATPVPLLAPPDEAVTSAARAGALTAVADGFLVVTGTLSPVHAVYGELGPGDVWVARLGESRDRPSWVVTGPDGSEAETPDARTVESELRELAEREDVPAFRELAGRLGQWVLERGPSVPLVFDRVVDDGTTFAESVPAVTRTTDELEPSEVLAVAWTRFQDRLVGEHRRHPWPPWVLGDDLVEIWSSMAGVTLDRDRLADCRTTADALAGPGPRVVDERTALADHDEVAKQILELRGHIAGLERTLGFRDAQLLTREKRIRELHADLQKMERIRNHPAYRTMKKATAIRDPKKFASAAKKKAAKELRKRR